MAVTKFSIAKAALVAKGGDVGEAKKFAAANKIRLSARTWHAAKVEFDCEAEFSATLQIHPGGLKSVTVQR